MFPLVLYSGLLAVSCLLEAELVELKACMNWKSHYQLIAAFRLRLLLFTSQPQTYNTDCSETILCASSQQEQNGSSGNDSPFY